MNKQHMRKVALAVALGLVAVALAACGSATAGSPPSSPSVAPAQSRPPTPVANVPGNSAAGQTNGSAPGDPIARGELIFQKTAGGVGCQACHGPDARGNVGPDIRGKSEGEISNALASVEQMQFIMLNTPLSKEDIAAVAAYLKKLADQP